MMHRPVAAQIHRNVLNTPLLHLVKKLLDGQLILPRILTCVQLKNA